MSILKAKDFVTTGNLLCGFLACVAVVEARLEVASLLVLLALAFDSFDGYVARKFKQADDFGALYDGLADMMSYTIATSLIAYGFLSPVSKLAGILASIAIMVAGVFRLARFNAKGKEVPGFFEGLPRPILAIILLSFLNAGISSSVYISLGFVFVLAYLNTTLIPFLGHHDRVFDARWKAAMMITVVGLAYAVYSGAGWIYLFGFGLLYVLSPLVIRP